MSIQITRSGKQALIVSTPVMNAAGILGFGQTYRDLIPFEKLGAMVTNPITYEPYSPAQGPRVVPLDAGMLLHTGIPNIGLKSALKEYRQLWAAMPCPLIVHLVCDMPLQVVKAVEMLDKVEAVQAIELGLRDDVTWQTAEELIRAATRSEKPILVRLPATDLFDIAQVASEGGAGALVVAAPPRGMARDPRSGRMVTGRLYGPLIKPSMLNLVNRIHQTLPDIPIIGAGGIHSPQDARDYLEAGAVAVQVDSAVWVQPTLLERIARDLGGWLVTRMANALADEWHPDMGDTEFKRLMGDDTANQS